MPKIKYSDFLQEVLQLYVDKAYLYAANNVVKLVNAPISKNLTSISYLNIKTNADIISL